MNPTPRVVLAERIEDFPDGDARLAALVRQLLRARDAGDQVAAWLTANAICSRLTSDLEDLLAREPSWDSDKRWLDGLSQREIVLERPECICVTGAMIWGLSEDAGGPQWAEPFSTRLFFEMGFARLVRQAIKFADQRVFADESLRQSIPRITWDIESDLVEWKYELGRSFG